MGGMFSASPFAAGGFGAANGITLRKPKIPAEQAALVPTTPTQSLQGFGQSVMGRGPIFRPVTLRMGQPAAPGGPVPSGGIPQNMPIDGGSAKQPGQSEAKLVDRLCALATKFSDKEVDSEIASRIFWSYLDNARVPAEVALPQVQARCPGIAIPARPSKPAVELKKPEKEGFHGKTQISCEEAEELSGLLDVVLAPLTPEEAAKEIAKEECLRELTDAGGFPIVERLQERLQDFLATAKPADTFEISQGEMVVTGKAVECAEALGRVRMVRTIVTAGGVVAGGGALLLILGIL